MTGPNDQQLAAIASDYSYWLDNDQLRMPDPQARKQLRAVSAAAAKASEALNKLNARATQELASRVGGQLSTDGNVALLTASRTLQAVVDSANAADAAISRHKLMSAQRMAATKLQALFAHHGWEFTASFDPDFETSSAAVAAMLRVARLAGDTQMSGPSAKDWIRKAIDEARHAQYEGKLSLMQAAAIHKSAR